MKKVAIFLTLIFLGLQVPGQVNKYGIPIIKNYSAEQIHGSDYTHSIIKDKPGNIYLANEDMGIIRYDGNNWRTIPVRNNQIIRALGIDKQGVIYAGGKYEFGYLEPDNYGKMIYVSLSKRFEESETHAANDTTSGITELPVQKIKIGEILSLIVKESNVYFVSDQALFDYDIIKDTLKYVNLQSLNLKNVLKAFLVGERVILGDNTSGLYEYKNGKVEMLPGGDFFNRMRCMVIMQYSENKAIVATFENGLFLYNYVTGEVNKEFVGSSLKKLLTESRIYSGTVLPNGEFALGTIQGGVFIVNHDGILVKNWNKDNSGMMDNGILAFYCDQDANSELWISTVRFISKVYINVPLTEFSPKSGIDGGVNSICEMDGSIYVSTDLGVFKSFTDINGQLVFSKIPEIIDQVFPVFHAKTKDEDFVLAGSINGIFQIFPNGKVIKIKDAAQSGSGKIKKLDISARTIVQSKSNPNVFYIGCYAEGVNIIEYSSGKWMLKKAYKNFQGSIIGVVEAENGDLIFGTDFKNYVYRVSVKDSVPVLYGTDKGIPESSINSIDVINNDILLSTNIGIYKYLKVSDSWTPFNEVTGNYSEGKEAQTLMMDTDNDLWYSFKDTRYSEMLFKSSGGKITSWYGPLALLPNIKMIDIKNINGKIWMSKSNSVFVIDKEKLFTEIKPVSPLLTKIVVGNDSVRMDETFSGIGEWGKRIPVVNRTGVKIPEFRYNLNSISFYWSAPYYINEEATGYSYILDGFDKGWSGWEKLFYKDYTNLPYGHYYFRVKARTALDMISSETVYEFVVLKPWYLTIGMIAVYSIALFFIVLGIIKAYTKKLKNENIRLEGIVVERTAVVVKQKEELESSIHYASRIQMALLPSQAILSENIKNYFVLFRPRDIVSGDFYWMTKKGDRLYIVAADCTGHGVPGAFMSLLGMSFLDEIIDKELAPRADYILHELRLHVTDSLKQVGDDNEAKDGMDIALLVIDFRLQKIEYSGAYNPCFRVRKLEESETARYADDSNERPDGSMSNGKYLLETIYPSKMPIGISSRMNEEFVFHDWPLEKGISYYLFSDGYIDQFGGPNGRKFMKKSFKRLILEIQESPMERQKELLLNNLNEWKGDSPQIDDILVMGIRIE
jgi:serine phosphatase RsbU (regulator of sigma subunit)